MPASRGVVPIEQLRRAAAQHVAAVGERRAAKDIGISRSGLHYFIEGGGTLYTPTRRKLERWYAQSARAVSAEAAFQALQVLVQELPEAQRGAALARLVRAVDRVFQALGRGSPAWLEKVRQMAAEMD